MDKLPDRIGNLEAALDAFERGFIPVAMLPGRKAPAEKWSRWMTEAPTLESIHERWGGTRSGVALLCKDLVVFDVDDESLLDFVLERCGVRDAPICRTPRGGFHVHAKARRGVPLDRKIKVKGQPVDLLTKASLSIIPPSTNEEGIPYAWLGEGLTSMAELPVARIGWTRERTKRRVVEQVERCTDLNFMERRALAWLEKVPGAVSHAGGHNATFRVACKLTHYFRLDRERALRLIRIWNLTCRPPWQDGELEHKVDDALKKRP